MMLSTQHPLAEAYLHRLRLSTAGLPPQEQAELISSIAEHIAAALAEIDDPAESDVRTVLQRLGEPEAIAAEAGGQSAMPAERAGPAKPGLLEWGGVATLGLGSYLVPVAGTIAGLVMVCLSRWWTPRQKVVAVVISLLPGLLVLIGGLALFQLSGDRHQGPAVVTTEIPFPSPVKQRLGD